MDKKTVSIIIPNYNGAKLLVKNLPKVVAAADSYSSNTEIIVIDDGSTDESREVLNKFSKIKVIIKEKNEGFSATCNLGVSKAKGDVVLLLNSDVWPEKNFLNFIVPHFDDANVFGVGCLDKSLENGKEIDRGRGVGWFKKGFLIHSRGEVNNNNTLWVSGGSSAFNRKIWNDLGGFDESFNPFYWEDIDLSYRAQKKGYKVIFESKAIVHHEHEEGAIKTKYSENEVKTIAYRNQFMFVWKNITDGKLVQQHVLYLPLHLLKAAVRGDTPYLVGFINALFKLKKLKRYSNVVESISDAKILAQFVREKN